MVCGGLIAGTKCAPKHLGRVLVLGLGTSGRSVVEYCLPLIGKRVEGLAIAAGARTAASEAFAAEAVALGAQVAFGDDAVTELLQTVDGRFDLCIPSPGIPQFSPLYQHAASVSEETMSEVEFAWRESSDESRWVAVTGTNGKTTVVSCVAHVLRTAGLRAAPVGNIGTTCLSAVRANDVDIYVAEVSSYQLASTTRFAPNVAVLLNITPDHLHWHRNFEAYRLAKLKILENLASVSHSVAILDATNDIVRAEVRSLRRMEEERGFTYVALGTSAGLHGDMRTKCGSDNAAFVDEQGMLRVAVAGHDHAFVRVDELLMPGVHNVGNALAAAAASLVLGVDAPAIVQGLRTFAPLEHRIEPCGFVRGVALYNDSKATNVDATLKALAAFPHVRPIVLLGGEDKGTDLAPLVAAAYQHVRAVVCFGAAGDRFAAAFADAGDGVPQDFVVKRALHLQDALDGALALADEGDVIVLSPACASFDEFGSFEERGQAFKDLVAVRSAREEA